MCDVIAGGSDVISGVSDVIAGGSDVIAGGSDTIATYYLKSHHLQRDSHDHRSAKLSHTCGLQHSSL